MAALAPLEFDLSGYDQFRTAARGGVGAASDASRLAEEAFRANAARRAAWQATNNVTPEMLTRANSFGGAAPSVPIGDNPAPVATARAASSPSFGARAMRGAGLLGRAGRLLGRAAAPIAALDFGVRAGEMLMPDKAAVGLADMVGTLGAKLGIPNDYHGGSAVHAAAAAALDPSAAPAPAPAPPVAPTVADILPQLASGREGNNVAIAGSRVEPRAIQSVAGRQAQLRAAYAPTPYTETPTSATGGPFTQLNDMVSAYGPARLAVARANRDVKIAHKAEELGIKRSDSEMNREAQAQNAVSNRMKAYADILKEQHTAARENVRTIQGIDGNPILVDQRAGTAKKIIPTERPTLEKFLTEARKDPRNKAATDAQLKAYYSRTYGG